MKKTILSAVVLATALTSCGTKWEYKTVTIDGDRALAYLKEDFDAHDFAIEDTLNVIGSEGWELISAVPVTETCYPNFGSDEYVTGIRTNTRTRSLQLIFKRQK